MKSSDEIRHRQGKKVETYFLGNKIGQNSNWIETPLLAIELHASTRMVENLAKSQIHNKWSLTIKP